MDSEPVDNNPLFDISPSSAVVNIDGKPKRIYGVPFRIVMEVAREAPDVLSFFFGGKISFESMMQKSPGAIDAIIAAGLGKPDDAETKRLAGNLSLDIQFDLIAAILKQTTGGGVGPFVEKIKALQNALLPPAANEPKPLRFKMREPGPPPSSNSSLAAAG